MNVAVRYFASVREALGRTKVLRSARNRVLCSEDTPLVDGDEVAFFPPLTGG